MKLSLIGGRAFFNGWWSKRAHVEVEVMHLAYIHCIIHSYYRIIQGCGSVRIEGDGTALDSVESVH